MFASKIRRMHWRWQLALWPLYGALWLMSRMALVAFQLIVKGSTMPVQVFLLMLIAAGTLALMLVFGNDGAGQILGPIMKIWVILAVAYFVVRTIVKSLKP